MIPTDEIKKPGAVYMNARIYAIQDTTPHLRRISLKHELLKEIGPLAPGAHFKIFIPPAQGAPATLPELLSGRPVWPDGKDKPYIRTYTVRSLDRVTGILDVEFVLHGDSGPASAWAERVAIGNHVGIGLKKTGKVHVQADWYLLAGDETATPAITAMLEVLPATTKGIALLEAGSDADIFPIKTDSAIEIRWLIRNGKLPEQSDLIIDAVKNIVLPDALLNSRLVWVAGEENMVKNMRKYASEQLGLDREELRATVYWKAGLSEDDDQ
ncbi:NADPH-dependent ferric siderophore reductase [Pedobacter cryoconitis]|uniref:siderophore-interacting protein n=1 Tax=Pedobacter cryoconitis TaxID=188932 RepID=UPI001606F70B|nr:siderophore-interacting protein [Pedobacter cryoconitis]MBB6274103.1 NADPH-dependent ferric siderophore reductase [Pedobacter cryoconitis]